MKIHHQIFTVCPKYFKYEKKLAVLVISIGGLVTHKRKIRFPTKIFYLTKMTLNQKFFRTKKKNIWQIIRIFILVEKEMTRK